MSIGTWRRLTTAGALLGALFGANLAQAAPDTVGQFHDDSGTIAVRGTDGRNYEIQFRLQDTSGAPEGSAVLSVSYRGCLPHGKCGFTLKYQIRLLESQVVFADANTATVTANFAGKPLRLSWSSSPDPGSTTVKVNAQPPDTVSASDPTSGGRAQLMAQVFGLRCSGSGQILNEVGFFQAPAAGGPRPPTTTPAPFRPQHRHHAVCESG